MTEMKAYLSGLTDEIDAGDYYPEAGDVEADLLYYFETVSELLPPPTTRTTSPLVGKIAGNDSLTDHPPSSSAGTKPGSQ